MQKIRKILKAVSEKTVTNQLIITSNIDFIGAGWHQSKNK